MATLKQYKYKYLISKGLMSNEARVIAGQYTMAQIKKLPYLRSLIRQRVSQRNRLQQLGYNYKEYVAYIKAFYDKKGWGNLNNENDIWKMLKSHRKDTIVSGDYVPPTKPKTKNKGVSKGDIQGQKKRAKKREHITRIKDRIALLNRNIKVLKDEDTKSRYRHEVENLKRELDQLR